MLELTETQNICWQMELRKTTSVSSGYLVFVPKHLSKVFPNLKQVEQCAGVLRKDFKYEIILI